jgi:voltage-gated potassium channel
LNSGKSGDGPAAEFWLEGERKEIEMQEVSIRLKILLALFVLITGIGTVGFMYLEHLSFVESLYYNIVTMSTVGYGDIHPTHQTSRIFAVLLIVLGGATFLGLIANVTEIIILKRETQSRVRKINMILGVFFSEVGYALLILFSSHDHTIEEIRGRLLVQSDWQAERFAAAQRATKEHDFKVDARRLDMEDLGNFLNGRRGFLVGLLQNPVLIEHEDFSEALLAVFHLLDELTSRDTLHSLPDSDRQHLAGDIERVYKKLVEQWLFYLMHLKGQYPYLFSLAVRKNPFDREATPVVLSL